MSLENLKVVIMRRDDMSSEDFDSLMEDAKEMLEDGMDPEEYLHSELSIEPDYVFDLLELTGMI